MALIPYSLSRAALFSMDAEAAHEFTIRSLSRLQHTPLRCTFAQLFVNDPVTLCGLRFPNRVGLAAGLDKNAECIAAWEAMGFGFVEVGTVTPKGQPGNPKPRMFRLPPSEALINRMGFNNHGLDAFIRNVQRTRPVPSKSLLGLNIGKNASTPIEQAADDYLAGLDGVYPWADYVTVNISSPNTQNLRALQSDAVLDALLDTLMERRELLAQQHGKHKPLFIKIAPDLEQEQIALIASTLRRYGMTADGRHGGRLGVIATNTTISREAVQGQPHADEAGGLSGRPVFEKSNHVIRELRAALGTDFPIIGAGGIMSGADARAKRAAGADVVQVFTGLIYRGSALVREVAEALQPA